MKGNEEMNNEEQILNLAKDNNGYITTSMVEANGIKRQFLGYLVKKGKIERVDRGIYILPEEPEDIYFILQNKSKKMIFSHITALRFHNLSDRIPHIIDITVTNEYRGSLQDKKDINLFRIKKEFIDLGMIYVKSPYGNLIKIYDLERSICDIIRNKKNIELELFNKAIRGYYNKTNKDQIKLFDYAKKLGIEQEVLNAFEVLS
ncbi:MAG: type IV toxin-antitoxin system AbiEi family antitoxin domain-containing protein [Bacilli bacterium]|nr:type IV toxin-antitoxin system AbiEi family antitoxin domain-containing protein [Bacilli bacterium]